MCGSSEIFIAKCLRKSAGSFNVNWWNFYDLYNMHSWAAYHNSEPEAAYEMTPFKCEPGVEVQPKKRLFVRSHFSLWGHCSFVRTQSTKKYVTSTDTSHVPEDPQGPSTSQSKVTSYPLYSEITAFLRRNNQFSDTQQSYMDQEMFKLFILDYLFFFNGSRGRGFRTFVTGLNSECKLTSRKKISKYFISCAYEFCLEKKQNFP